MPLPSQGTFFGNSIPIGNLEARILGLYKFNREVGNSDRLLALELWKEEGLEQAIAGGLEEFRRWFINEATPYESISRASRKLRAAGIIKASPEVTEARKQLAEQHRQYWQEK